MYSAVPGTYPVAGAMLGSQQTLFLCPWSPGREGSVADSFGSRSRGFLQLLQAVGGPWVGQKPQGPCLLGHYSNGYFVLFY